MWQKVKYDCSWLFKHIACMMTSSNGNIFRVTGPLCGNPPVNSPHKGQWHGTLMFSLISARTNGRANNRDAGDLRRNRVHHNVTVMWQNLHIMHPITNSHSFVMCWFVAIIWPVLSRSMWFIYPYALGLPHVSDCASADGVTLEHMDKIGWYLTTTNTRNTN